jgi:hypothetical protein
LVWRDGAPSGIAIWHVPPASNNARIFVDVPPLQGPALNASPVVIAGTSRDLDSHESPSLFLLPGGRRSTDIVGVGIASDNHVYAWYRDGTVSAGAIGNLGSYRQPYPYSLPAGRTPKDIVAIDIASDDHVYAWYRDGMVSAGASRDLGVYRQPAPYTLPPGRTPADIVGIGIAGDDHIYVWYRDGKVSSGNSRKLDAYRPVDRYSLPLGRVPADILDIAIDTDDRVHTWLEGRGNGEPIVVTAYMTPGGVVAGRPARLLVKTTDGFGRPLENVAVSVGATSGTFPKGVRLITDDTGLTGFDWQAPHAPPAGYDGRALIEIRATRYDRADGLGMVDVPVMAGGAIQ